MSKFSKSGVKSPRFFCETCGLEVSKDADRCANCGKYFSSVRCPACEFTGAEDLFNQGCPVCGYSNVRDSASEKKTRRVANNKNSEPDVKLPLWIYLLTAAVFTAIMAALFALML